MAWPNGTRSKTATSGGSWTPTDMNALSDQVLQVAGYRGKSIIATEETRTNTAYGLMTTPDRVTGIVLPTDGLIVVQFHALWKQSVDLAARAAIFLGSNQLLVHHGASAPVVSDAQIPAGLGTPTDYNHLLSAAQGLTGEGGSTGVSSTLTTGTALAAVTPTVYVGGQCLIYAAAGTYDVSVQFKSSSGDVTVKERKLWVSTLAFE